MKIKIAKYLFSACMMAGMTAMTGCNFLDIVPDERAKEEDAFKDYNAARGFLYSCYSYIPRPNNTQGSLDLMTGDEVVTPFTQGSEIFNNFPYGTFNADNTVISYWNTLYGGIRQCYILQNNLDNIPGIEPHKEEFKAEINFLLGYFHMQLFRCYGPIIVVKELPDVNTSPENYLGRSSLAETVQFICDRFDDAINSPALPVKREGSAVGRGTKIAAMAFKAYTLMYYASPLLNGGYTEYTDKVVDTEGNKLIPSQYDPQRWVDAREAYKAAIKAAEDAGHELFDIKHVTETVLDNDFPQHETIRHLRANMATIVRYNPEEIFTMVNGHEFYGFERKSLPYINGQAWCGVAPTMSMLDRFYTKNGLPYDVDPDTQGNNKYKVITTTQADANMTFSDGTTATVMEPGKETSQMNLGREPRYYAWIAFQGGYYEVKSSDFSGGYTSNGGISDKEDERYNKLLIADFTKYGNCGRQGRDSDYPPTGFLNKKGVSPDIEMATNNGVFKNTTWPILRLGEMYLSYAECCAESGDETTAKEYLNYVRERAGIPSVETSWAMVGKNPTGRELIDIIRRERQIEMYLENHNFWDMRRWLLAGDHDGVTGAFNHKHTGMNTQGETVDDFSKPTEINYERSFDKNKHYLLPIPATDINNNHNIKQNPGY